MLELLRRYEEKAPEIVFEWHDPETEAIGWVVINSLRGGAAGGGTRMRKGLDRREVESLAKTMEIKFSVSGPAIGGAKSGIDFDPQDPRKHGVLQRWYKAVSPLLKNYYGTGGDMNVDEIHEVIPITEEFGIWHPQEGIVNGHFRPTEAQKIHKIGQLRAGVSKVVENPKYVPTGALRYRVADMITGYGVSESVRHFYAIYRDQDVRGKRLLVQGWGNVAAPAAWYLSRAGAKVVGIIDRNGGIIEPDGLSAEEVHHLFVSRQGNALSSPRMLPFDEVNKRIWDLPADIFLPCAGSRLVSSDQVDRMAKAGVSVISCGANVPFADKEIFFGPTMQMADARMSVIPDFVANCGMARVFAYLMSTKDLQLTDQGIFVDASQTIRKAIRNIHRKDPSAIGISARAMEIALKQLM
jgi:glutamate dehydrogenase/leucine dehydrogenase